MPETKPTSVDEYIAAAPAQAQPHLRKIRAILREVAPDAREAIKWGSPVLEQGRILFSFSAHKAHLNFMPTGPSLEPFRDALEGFKTGKDTIQFPYDRPLPRALIVQIATHRVNQVLEHGARWMY